MQLRHEILSDSRAPIYSRWWRVVGGVSVFGVLVMFCLAGDDAFASPQILEPKPGVSSLLTPVSQVNPTWPLIFTPVPDAARYGVELSGVDLFEFNLTEYTDGEVVVGSVVLPPHATGGSYDLKVQALDASGLPLGDPSEAVSMTLVETSPVEFAPTEDLEMSGVILASSVTVPTGVTITATDDLTILSLGFVAVDGTIESRGGTQPGEDGANLTLTAAFETVISGTILAGDGSAGAVVVVAGGTAAEPATAIGEDGGNGGSITLLARDADIMVGASARIQTGSGARGGDAIARGAAGSQPGEGGGLAHAEGGAAGNGGDLAIVTPGGGLSVAQIPSILIAADGGTGGDAIAEGGRGADALPGSLPGLGGVTETFPGAGGNSGNLSLTTLDWNDDGVIALEELDVVGEGGGGVSGDSFATLGENGAENLAWVAKGAVCSKGPGTTPATVVVAFGPAGAGTKRPANGTPAVAVGIAGVGSGTGGTAIAVGGNGGSVLAIGLFQRIFGPVVVAGNGGSAKATGGAGGPAGGEGGFADATGGVGGSAGYFAIPGAGGSAQAFGGTGSPAPPCCIPPGPGLSGGNGGDAWATGGAGGNGDPTGGAGGSAGAQGGTAGAGGDGCPAGPGGLGGIAAVTLGGGGPGGPAGVVLFLNTGPGGPPGLNCCRCISDQECDNDLFCDGVETCDPPNGCQAGTSPCSFGQTCNETTDSCEGDTCSYAADFELGADGWTLGLDTCTTGAFIVGSPDATEWQVGGGNPGQALFTAANPGGLGVDDVDGGTCETLSPLIDCRNAAAVEISLDYFHGQRDAGDDASDGFTVEVLDDGVVAETLVLIGDVTHPAAWTPVSTILTDPGKIQVRVRATDAPATGDVLEGGIDNVRIQSVPAPPCPVHEDFEGGAVGWLVDPTSTCSSGTYVVGNPTFQTHSGVTTQPAGSFLGVGSMFTATNTNESTHDVDGGNCIVGSPTWPVAAASTASVWWWHGQRDTGDDSAGDFFSLEVSTDGGVSWSSLASNGDVTSNAVWTQASAPIPAGSNVQLKMQCSDGAAFGDLIECGFDEVSICTD